MAEVEMYDYLSAVSPDYNSTLDVSPQEVLPEIVEKNQVIHKFDDGSERVVSLDDTAIFHVKLRWNRGITKSDAGTIFDFYADASKANGMARSFKWDHPLDGHTYVVRFRSELSREWFESATHQRYSEVVFKVLGRINDT